MGSEVLLSGAVKIYSGRRGRNAGRGWRPVTTSIWTLLGEEYYTEDGVRITHSETIEKEMILASTLGQAPKRTAEAHTLAVNLMDAKIETKAILSGNAVTTVVATSSQIGTVQVALKRGHYVKEYALMMRGTAPYVLDDPEDENALSYYLPQVYVMSVGEYIKHKRAEVLACRV